MREKDEITGLFRSRLSGTEMTVREGFWEQLQEDAASPAAGRKRAAVLSPKYYRVAAAASVIFVLGAASAAFWYFSPKEEIKEAFTQVAALTPEGNLDGDVVQESFPSIHQATPMVRNSGTKQPADGIPAGMTAQSETEASPFPSGFPSLSGSGCSRPVTVTSAIVPLHKPAVLIRTPLAG